MAEVRKTQPLQQRLAIVDPNTGQPSDYFMKYIALHGGAITDVDALVLELQAQLGAKADKVTQINTGTGLTGGGDLSADRTFALTTTGVTPGTYGSATKSAVITVDAYGRITAITEVDITGTGGGGGGGGGSTTFSGTKWRIVYDLSMAQYLSGDNNAAADEIEMRATAGGADQCTGGTAISSSDFSGSFAAANAFANDGSSSGWVSSGGVPGAWIGYDFGSAKSVKEINLLPRNGIPGESPTNGVVQYWDGSAWQLAWPLFDNTNWSAGVAKNITQPNTGERWRIYVVSATGSGVLGFNKVEMRSAIGGADQCTGGTPAASSFYNGSYLPENAFDGTSSEWATQNGAAYSGSWIGYDFHTAKNIVEVALTARAAADGISGGLTFNVEKFDATTNTWTVVGTHTTSGFAGGETKVIAV